MLRGVGELSICRRDWTGSAAYVATSPQTSSRRSRTRSVKFASFTALCSAASPQVYRTNLPMANSAAQRQAINKLHSPQDAVAFLLGSFVHRKRSSKLASTVRYLPPTCTQLTHPSIIEQYDMQGQQWSASDVSVRNGPRFTYDGNVVNTEHARTKRSSILAPSDMH
jgi:hypothetical protein